MSTLDEDGITTDRLLELLRKRIIQWEEATSIRGETEAAEAFTRAFAELDEALKDGGKLPDEWRRSGGIPAAPLRDLARKWIGQVRENHTEEADLILGHVQQLHDILLDAGGAGPPTGSLLQERFGSHEVRIPHKPGEDSGL